MLLLSSKLLEARTASGITDHDLRSKKFSKIDKLPNQIEIRLGERKLTVIRKLDQV